MNERLSHQCHRDGCDSEALFATKVTLTCRAPGQSEVVKMTSSIKVCARHAVAADVRRYILSDRNRETILTSLTEGGHLEPDFLSLQVEFEPLETAKVPLIVNRPVLTCDRAGCTKVAKWQVEELFRMMWQRGRGKPLVRALTNLCVCDEHRHSLKPADLLDPESKSTTLAWLNSREVSMPDFDTMQIDFVPVRSGRRADPRVWVGDDGPVGQFAKSR